MPTDILFDCESNGLLDTVTMAWCVATINITSGERRLFELSIEDALEYLDSADRLIGHNILRYDLPMLWQVYRWKPRPGVVLRDTKVIARLKFPNIHETDGALIHAKQMPPGDGYRGKHTIGAWGYRLGKPKLHEDIEDWSRYTREMGERCVGDCETNLALWEHLRADEYSQSAVDLEHRCDVVVGAMEEAGVPFDTRLAGALHTDLMTRSEELEKALKAQFGWWLAKDGKTRVPKKPFQRNGVWTMGPYDKLKVVHFNPRSNRHVEKVLKDLGWEPDVFTKSGQAEINEKTIEDIVYRFKEMEGLGEYKMIQKRLGALVEGKEALLKNVQADGRIHGAINPMGTTTSRASHYHPNLGAVPSAKKPYGERFRACFRMPPGWCLVGADQESLEGRGVGHYMAKYDGGAYAEVLLSGDPHWRSTKALGFVGPDAVRDKHDQFHVIVREGSKRFYYAFLYGAYPKKLGSVILDICLACRAEGFPEPLDKFFKGRVKPSVAKLKDVGGEAQAEFLAAIPGMGMLKAAVAESVKLYQAVLGLDGRIIPTRSEHSALNFLVQSAGAIICKRWLCDAYDELEARFGPMGWSGLWVMCLWVHDEIQVACRPDIAKEVGAILVKHAKLAGTHYGFRIPLDSSADIGDSWAATH